MVGPRILENETRQFTENAGNELPRQRLKKLVPPGSTTGKRKEK